MITCHVWMNMIIPVLLYETWWDHNGNNISVTNLCWTFTAQPNEKEKQTFSPSSSSISCTTKNLFSHTNGHLFCFPYGCVTMSTMPILTDISHNIFLYIHNKLVWTNRRYSYAFYVEWIDFEQIFDESSLNYSKVSRKVLVGLS